MPLGIARHIITEYTGWSPGTDITTAIWIDASDTSSYSLSGSDVTAVTDKGSAGATFTVNGTPSTSTTLNSLKTFTFDAGSNESLTTNEVHQASSGNHWAIGVWQWSSVNNTKDSFWPGANRVKYL